MIANGQINEVGNGFFRKRLNERYFCERIIDVLPALRQLSHESNFNRNEILSLLAAKAFQRQNNKSFTSKDIATSTGIPYNNINLVLNCLCQKGLLVVEVRGRKADYSPTRYTITMEGLAVVTRLDVIALDRCLANNPKPR